MKKIKQAIILGLATALLTPFSFAAIETTHVNNRVPSSKTDQKALAAPHKKEQKGYSADDSSAAKQTEDASELEPADMANLEPSESGTQH